MSAGSRVNRSMKPILPRQKMAASSSPRAATGRPGALSLLVSRPGRSRPWWVHLMTATLRPRLSRAVANRPVSVVLPEFLKPVMPMARIRFLPLLMPWTRQ